MSVRSVSRMAGWIALAAMILLFFLFGRFTPELASFVSGREVLAVKNVGDWGDGFGPFNAFLALLTLFGVVATIRLQLRGLSEQAAEQHRQRFESRFFELLRLLREARTAFTFYNTPEFLKAYESGAYVTFSEATTGRQPKDAPLDPFAAAAMEVHFQLVRGGRGARKDRLRLIKTYMRYVHSHSEPTIAPYFRILHALLQRISNDPILDEDEKIHYGNLVRGQLSSAEVVLLGVNSLLPISGDMKSFVTEFRMLKYLPKSSMRTILQQFHEPIAFTKRNDPPPPAVPSPGHLFADADYRALVAAVHAERKLQRLSREELDRRLRKRGFVAAYEDGNHLLGIADLVDVARALKKHPALFLRYP